VIFLKRAFAPKEVKEALSEIESAEQMYDSTAFNLVRTHLERGLLAKPEKFVKLMQQRDKNWTREWVHSVIGNIAGDLLETGQYHIYRGVLNPMGPGEALLKMFDQTYDELLKMKATDSDYAEKQKQALREHIKTVG